MGNASSVPEVTQADMERGRLIVERLRSRYVPSSAEADEIRQTITEASQYREVLDESISAQENLISSLSEGLTSTRAKRDAVERFISMQSSFLSPIRRLPEELLLEIFDLACLENEITSTGIGNHPVLMLSHTCHTWRELALSYPKLWSRITILLERTYSWSEEYPEESSTVAHLLELHMFLSKDHPLDIRISFPEEQMETIGNVRHCDVQMLRHLTENAYRWRSLHCLEEVFLVLPNPSGDLPQLRDVTFKTDGYFEEDGHRPEMSWLTRAHNVKRVTILSKIPFPLIPFDWSGLICLTVDDIRSDWTSGMIQDCLSHLSTATPNLEELRWQISIEDDVDQIQPCLLNNLRCLRVGWDVCPDWIVAPKLRHLDTSERAQEEYALEDVGRLLQSSGANLLSFTMSREHLYHCGQYLTSFDSMKDIVNLTCCKFGSLDMLPLLHFLIVGCSSNSTARDHFPRLQKLTVYCSTGLGLLCDEGSGEITDCDMVIDASFVSFLESRRAQKPLHFEIFEVVTPRNPASSTGYGRYPIKCENTACKERLRRLHSDGLSLCFNDDWSPVENLKCVEPV